MRNPDIRALIKWMRAHNGGLTENQKRAAFYGLDIYNMSGSIGAMLDYLDRIDSDAAIIVRESYGCLTPWQKNSAIYGRAAPSRRQPTGTAIWM